MDKKVIVVDPTYVRVNWKLAAVYHAVEFLDRVWFPRVERRVMSGMDVVRRVKKAVGKDPNDKTPEASYTEMREFIINFLRKHGII